MSAKGRPAVSTIRISQIRRDGGTQIRAALDEPTVQEYTDAIKAGVKFPPIVVYHGELKQGTEFWLADGFHRVEAYLRAGIEVIACEYRVGTLRDAILAACGANAEHGLKRSNADKRRAVETFLADEEWRAWSDGKIAKLANVSRQTVSNIRGELAISPVEPRRVKGLDGRERLQPKTASPSTTGHTTPGPISPGNPPETDGEEGAGVPVAPASADTGKAAAPAPTEPRDRLINVERMLRDAQAEIAPLLTKGEALAIQAALVDALFLVRAAIDKPAPVSTTIEAVNGGPIAADSKFFPGQEVFIQTSGRGRSGWPEPPHPLRKGGLRVVMETPDGDVPFDEFDQGAGNGG